MALVGRIEEQFMPVSVLLTGGAGFIGSGVLLYLVDKYPAVRFTCVDKLSYCSSLRSIQTLKDRPNFKFVKGSVTSVDLMVYLLRTEAVDTIMHFAAQTHVDNSFGNSLSFTVDNVLGTHVLLEACKVLDPQIRRFIHVSSDEVYGEAKLGDNVTGALEKDALEPTNPYAATKAAAEYLVKAYHHSFGIPTIISRGNNVYGPRQYPEKLIPKFICLLLEGRPCPVHGTGANLRSYLYIDDVAEAFDRILRFGVVGETYNIGTSFELSNRDVLDRLLDLFGFGDQKERFLEFVEDRPYNDCRYRIDSSKVEALGWRPQVEFTEGLRRTIQWFRDNSDYFGPIGDVLVPHPTFRQSGDDTLMSAAM